MNIKRKTVKAMIAGAVALTIANAGSANAMVNMEGNEKCYGVVKAGKNMCGRKDGKHACMHMAETDGDPNEWILVPEGLCEKLVNGSLEPPHMEDNETKEK